MKGTRGCAFACLVAATTACSPGSFSAAPNAVSEPNSPPTLSGDDKCYSELGALHVFDLTVADPDGDHVSWRAQKRRPQGTLEANAGAPVASGSVIRIVYRPPSGPDENWIDVTATDRRGATARMALHVRNGNQ